MSTDKDSDQNEKDPNTVLIPREMTERKKLLASTTLTPHPLSPKQAEDLHRFDVLPASAISKDEEKLGYDYHIEDSETDEDVKKKKRKGRDPRAKDPSKQRSASGVCPSCGKGSSKVTVSGENYLHLYMEQQKQTKEQHLQMARQNAIKDEERRREENKRKEEEMIAERKRETETTVRARQIQDQINFWNQQKGQGQYDDATISNMLLPLETELNTIPTGYKR